MPRKRSRAELMRQFLREKGLTDTFRRYSRLAPARKTRIERVVSDYYDTSAGRRASFILSRTKRGYSVYDSSDYRKVGFIKTTSRARASQIAIERLAPLKVIDKMDNLESSSIENRQVRTRDYPSVNKTVYEVRTNKRIARRKGFLNLVADYIGNDGSKRRISSRSNLTWLDTQADRDAAFEKALQVGKFLFGASPKEVIVVAVFYQYFRERIW